MSAADALARIDNVLDAWFRGEIDEFMVLARIAYIIGQNAGTK